MASATRYARPLTKPITAQQLAEQAAAQVAEEARYRAEKARNEEIFRTSAAALIPKDPFVEVLERVSKLEETVRALQDVMTAGATS